MAQQGDNESGMITDTFQTGALNPYWRPWTIGSGTLHQTGDTLRCELASTSARQYSDAQITDYQGLARRDFPWRPPLRLTVRAWASPELKGTAGFGFWNEPFVPVGSKLPRLPRAAWFFFASPPNNMALAKDVPGWGWKAATLDATRWPFLLLAPFALPGFLLMRIPALYRRLWPVGQWAVGASEALLPVDVATPHTYELEWRLASVCFSVDGSTAHTAPVAPRGPLGFIAWVDNQYAVVTPQGRFKFGLVANPESQWLALDRVEICPL
ncbi:MAG: hypothetical protein JXQ72_08695 [Anaerolineae bacterium]|nr:hypothetical protein [Anaerolineae bacterium]